ncbi:hypothetical protein [Flavobacterium sp.]|uniref:hypothetical protein n=1 Tax=Flavobacterium sp. TaxID=239 RepID=UPI0031D3B103
MKKNIFPALKNNKLLIRITILFVTLIISCISYSCLKKNDPPVYAEIPDANFKTYLKTIVPLAFTSDGKFISNHSSVISYGGPMSVRGKKISSLSGIEYFSALRKLDCSNNVIVKLDISKNIALTDIYCGYNKLSTLDVSKNTNLVELNCSKNQITTLDLIKNVNLTELLCFGNHIKAIRLGDNPVLQKIYCPYNQIVILDVSKNNALVELNCKENLQNTVIIVNPEKLSRLYIDDFIKCNHPSIKVFKDNGGELYGTYSEVISSFVCQ